MRKHRSAANKHGRLLVAGHLSIQSPFEFREPFNLACLQLWNAISFVFTRELVYRQVYEGGYVEYIVEHPICRS